MGFIMNYLKKLFLFCNSLIIFIYFAILTSIVAIIIYFAFVFVSSFNDFDESTNKTETEILQNYEKKNTRKIYEKSFKEDYIKRCGQKHSLSYCKNLYEVYTETK
jgi:hypothetical protein